ncbi:MAG TPA: hypothetical protein VK465_11465, partial [Fibrobacteria bacterium]|nr:hypothetical protein [Fibrobacteria bacterium]
MGRSSARATLIFAGGILFHLCQPEMAQAANCSLQAPASIFAGDTARFSLVCANTDSLTFSWEIVATNPDEAIKIGYGPSPTFSHIFRSPGQYTFFARVRYAGEPSESFDALLTVLARRTPLSPVHSSNILWDASNRRLWTANADNHSVTVIDGATWERIREIPVGRDPRTLARGPDGSIWVTLQGEAALAVLDPASGTPRRRIVL